jgi:hypothetical protein
MNFLKLDVWWKKNWPLLTTKTMEVNFFKVKHKILKNSLHNQVLSDFVMDSHKILGKA